MAAPRKRLRSNRTTRPVITASSRPSRRYTQLRPPSRHLPATLTASITSICLLLPLCSPASSISAPLTPHASSDSGGNESPRCFLATLFPDPSSCVCLLFACFFFFFIYPALRPRGRPRQCSRDDAQLLRQIPPSLVCKPPVVVSPGELLHSPSCQIKYGWLRRAG